MPAFVIGIAGNSGSGKTTLAEQLCEHFGAGNCVIMSADRYFREQSALSFADRCLVNFDHPDSTEFELLADHVSALMRGESVDLPEYDFTVHNRKEAKTRVDPKPIIIVEGILVHHPDFLTQYFDVKIYVDTDADLCFIRRLQRDTGPERGRTMEEVIMRYQRDVKPMAEQFVKPCKKRADLVVKNNAKLEKTHEGQLHLDIDPVIAHLDSCRAGQKPSNQIKFQLFGKKTAVPKTKVAAASLAPAHGSST